LDYCATNNASILPLICNDFIKKRFEDPEAMNEYNLERDHCIDFSVVFFKWLFEQGFTDYRVTLIV
jgi:hypothetical protein